MSPDTSKYQYIKYQHPEGLSPGSGKVIDDLDFLFLFFLLIWTSYLFSSEPAFLWLIKKITEVKRKKRQENNIRKVRFTQISGVMIQVTEGTFCFVKKLCHKNLVCRE